MGRRGSTRMDGGNVPATVTSFVGRQHEIADIRRTLAATRLLTLTGVGGVGKTRLALEVAATVGRAFPDGVWLVDLAPVRGPELVAQTVGTSLRLLNQSARPAEEQLVDHLADRQTLIVLDNCEHLLDACASLADRLLRACPRVRILATSRETLGGPGEHVYTVAPLSVPDPDDPVALDALAGYDAPTLLVERARAVRADFALTDANRAAVARLCARLDGIPLAVELAASRLRSLSLDEILDRLEDRFALLTGGARTVMPRQRTLRALIDWSHELCAPEERLLWARLSVFTGGFTLDAAEEVCAGPSRAAADAPAGPELPATAIVDLVDHLVAQSIVIPAGGDGSTRYRMLETVREYGGRRLVDRGEDASLRDRHRDYYLALAEDITHRWDGHGQEASLARLRADHDNLQAALAWSTDRPGHACPTLRLVTALRYHWCADGYLGEGRRAIDRALRVTDGSDTQCPEARTAALWTAAWVRLLQGDDAAAIAALDECEARCAATSDRRSLRWATGFRGTSALFHGHLAESIAHFQRAVAGLADDDRLVRFVLFQLAIAQALAGDERARSTAERAIALADRRGERWSKSYALWALGFVHRSGGELTTATRLARTALDIQRGFNDHPGTALMLELLAWIAAADGEHRHAARLLGAIGATWRRIGTSISAFGPHLAEQHARCAEAVEAALPPDVLRAELAHGERLEHHEAITYALDERTEHGAGGRRATRDGVRRRKESPGSRTADTQREPHSAAFPTPRAVRAELTPREREVAALVAQGLSNRQIAEALVLSPRTADRHLENILAKLGFTSRTQVAAWVARAERDEREP